jgi:hypothetical protein
MALKRMEKAHLEKPKRGKGQCTLNRQLLGKQQKPKPKKPEPYILEELKYITAFGG